MYTYGHITRLEVSLDWSVGFDFGDWTWKYLSLVPILVLLNRWDKGILASGLVVKAISQEKSSTLVSLAFYPFLRNPPPHTSSNQREATFTCGP